MFNVLLTVGTDGVPFALVAITVKEPTAVDAADAHYFREEKGSLKVGL